VYFRFIIVIVLAITIDGESIVLLIDLTPLIKAEANRARLHDYVILLNRRC